MEKFSVIVQIDKSGVGGICTALHMFIKKVVCDVYLYMEFANLNFCLECQIQLVLVIKVNCRSFLHHAFKYTLLSHLVERSLVFCASWRMPRMWHIFAVHSDVASSSHIG